MVWQRDLGTRLNIDRELLLTYVMPNTTTVHIMIFSKSNCHRRFLQTLKDCMTHDVELNLCGGGNG